MNLCRSKTALEFQALRVTSLARFVAGAWWTEIAWQFLAFLVTALPINLLQDINLKDFPFQGCKHVHDLALGVSDELLATTRILIVTMRYIFQSWIPEGIPGHIEPWPECQLELILDLQPTRGLSWN